jgi:hypothetical protein
MIMQNIKKVIKNFFFDFIYYVMLKYICVKNLIVTYWKMQKKFKTIEMFDNLWNL